MPCMHEGCSCREASVKRGEHEFCSEHCADATARKEFPENCGCGHPECRARAEAPPTA